MTIRYTAARDNSPPTFIIPDGGGSRSSLSHHESEFEKSKRKDAAVRQLMQESNFNLASTEQTNNQNAKSDEKQTPQKVENSSTSQVKKPPKIMSQEEKEARSIALFHELETRDEKEGKNEKLLGFWKTRDVTKASDAQKDVCQPATDLKFSSTDDIPSQSAPIPLQKPKTEQQPIVIQLSVFGPSDKDKQMKIPGFPLDPPVVKFNFQETEPEAAIKLPDSSRPKEVQQNIFGPSDSDVQRSIFDKIKSPELTKSSEVKPQPKPDSKLRQVAQKTIQGLTTQAKQECSEAPKNIAENAAEAFVCAIRDGSSVQEVAGKVVYAGVVDTAKDSLKSCIYSGAQSALGEVGKKIPGLSTWETGKRLFNAARDSDGWLSCATNVAKQASNEASSHAIAITAGSTALLTVSFFVPNPGSIAVGLTAGVYKGVFKSSWVWVQNAIVEKMVAKQLESQMSYLNALRTHHSYKQLTDLVTTSAMRSAPLAVREALETMPLSQFSIKEGSFSIRQALGLCESADFKNSLRAVYDSSDLYTSFVRRTLPGGLRTNMTNSRSFK